MTINAIHLALPFFELLVKSVMTDNKVTLGNTEFWVDGDGPWTGSFSYSIPASRWEGVAEALTARLVKADADTEARASRAGY